MNRDNALIIILILLFFWWNRKNKSTNGGGSSTIITPTPDVYTGDCQYILDGGNNPPMVWAEENGLLVNSSEAYLVGVDPELKGDFKLFYYCCLLGQNDPNHTPRRGVGVLWIGNNDPEYYRHPDQQVGGLPSYMNGYSTKVQKIVDARLTNCLNNPSQTLNVQHPPNCQTATCQDINDYRNTCGSCCNIYGGITSCYNTTINYIPRYLPPCLLNNAMTTTKQYGNSPAIVGQMYPKMSVKFPVKWYGGGWGNMDAKLNNFNITFNWQKDDGSIATYSKSWDVNWTDNNLTACII